MAQIAGRLALYPARALFLWYFGMIAIGGSLLLLPICRQPEVAPITFTEAYFTATSASCVTGLAVRSTAHDFSFWGQLLILVLIQIGGVGIMTLTTLILVQLTGEESMRDRMTAQETLGVAAGRNLRRLLGRVIGLTLIIETAGMIFMWPRLVYDLGLLEGTWNAVFLSISAFCNAGFALNDESLVPFQGDLIMNLAIMTLIISGGIGFPVLLDLECFRRNGLTKGWERLGVHSKLCVIGSSVLILLGMLGLLVLEWENAFEGMPLWRKGLVSLFQSVSPRTAGFNTIDLNSLTSASRYMIILLMLVGACPGSTGGGFKVTTLMILVIHAWSKMRGLPQTQVFRRTIGRTLVDRSIGVALIFVIFGGFGLGLLLGTEEVTGIQSKNDEFFLDACFETVSALATVGLSLGVTANLTWLAKWILVMLMFIGRLGPITAVLAISKGTQRRLIEYPEASILTG